MCCAVHPLSVYFKVFWWSRGKVGVRLTEMIDRAGDPSGEGSIVVYSCFVRHLCRGLRGKTTYSGTAVFFVLRFYERFDVSKGGVSYPKHVGLF